MSRSLLEEIEPIIYHNRSSVAEGDIFSVLAHSPFVIRAFEFGLADGALSCSSSFDTNSSYAERFWEFDQRSRMPECSDEVLLFDGKGAIFHQEHVTSMAQLKHVAFYIGLCTADPRFVELIPNYLQNPDDHATVSLQEDQRRYLSINTDRKARLPLRTQGLNQTNSPFRMPMRLLKLAIARVRECALGRNIYVNPWTMVSFPYWAPKTTSASRFLKPLESTAHFTAYEAAMEIYRGISSQSVLTGMFFDFAGLQPRLADFKLILSGVGDGQFPPEASPTCPRQVYVQHKVHSGLLSQKNRFERINVVARRKAKVLQYYFTATNRFDYFFFQFTVSDESSLCPRVEFFFLPERVIPDSFYTDEALELGFDRVEFRPYKYHMDQEGD
ncbi:hypothetical protein D6D21_09968 [Aureobasidium pullulans]|uniref:Uncharacterized protein n=1 Tax=Aureobasidium pullulans TaxID=5580 RepID=A0AB74IJD4_AURPU|nr:hypothetical protein D6D21_09968 [Aureobasidium pullulans]